jgi:predicted nucleic acid-binding Zn ribbon protein
VSSDDPSDSDLVKAALDRARADAAGRAPAAPVKRTSRARRAPTPGAGPAVVGSLLRDWVNERGVDVDVAIARVLGCWGDVVGAEVAAHCAPDRLDAGVLHVIAESTAWATQLRLLGSQLLDRIRAEVAGLTDETTAQELIKEVRVTGPRSPSWKRGRLSVPGRGPRDTYG